MRIPSPGPPTLPRKPLPVSEERTAPQFQEVRGSRRVTEDLVERQKAEIDAQSAEILKLRVSKEKYAKGYRIANERIEELEHEIKELSKTHQEASEMQNQRIQAMEDQLRRNQELSETKPAERTRVKPLSSPSNRVSEVEVLGIVHNLNENLFQVSAHLAEEWEEFSLSQTDRFTVTKEDIGTFARSYGPTLVHQVLDTVGVDRNPATVTFLLQSCLCQLAAQVTSNWRQNQELIILRSLYRLLPPSGGREISAGWRSLAQSHLSEQPSLSVSITQHLADILWITGSFPSIPHSFDFVKAKAFNRIENIEQLVMRLKSIFAVDIVSSDMGLFVETPCSVFNNMTMAREMFTLGSQDMVVGTTGVGVEAIVGEGQGEGLRTEILLKAKVILEKDLADL